MEMYILKSAACLAVLLLFYKLLLEKENMHVFKRFYLLISVVAAIAIPMITFTTYVEPASENLNSMIFTSEGSSEVIAKSINYWPYILFGIYILGVLFFSIKFYRNLRSLIIKIRTNPKFRAGNFINVLLSEKIQPHTFFSFIFFNKEKYLQDQIPRDVKIHEEAHARQKHSLDVLFVELLQIVFWFNPLIFFLKNAIKLNHEFLADREVLEKGINASEYQKTLLVYTSGDLQSDLVNPINYSSIKKRLTVMKTKTSGKTVWTRSLAVLPLLAILLYGFSAKKTILQTQDQPEKIDAVDVSTIIISEDINIHIFKNEDILVNQQKVKIDELEERLNSINSDLSYETRKELTSARITISPGVKMGIITDVKMLLREYGVSRIEISESATPSPETESKLSPEEEHEKIKDLKVIYNHRDIVTPEMIKEYNKLVGYYNSLPRENRNVKQEDAERILFILNRMSPEQKAKAEKIKFDIPPTKPVPSAPKVGAASQSVPVPPTPPTPPAPPISRETKKDSMHPAPFKWIKNVPPPAPPEPSAVGVDLQSIPVPPAPPVPPKPEEHFKELAKEGATFYYGDKEISSAEAIELVKNTKNLSIHVTGTDGNKTVRIKEN